MKYFNMLKSFQWVENIKSSAKAANHTAEKEKQMFNSVKVETPPPKQIIDNTANEEILGLLREMRDKIEQPVGLTEKPTILNEEEVNNVLQILLQLQDNVFKNTPISQTLVKQFVWNIPREIYELSMKNYQDNSAPCMNPLYWFYVFCIDLENLSNKDRQLAFANAIGTAMGSMEQNDYEALMEQADEYESICANAEFSESGESDVPE